MNANFISQALGLPAPPTWVQFTGITTDSRKVTPGSLFVAVPGEKFDGHQFIPQAIRAGAAGILCREGAAPAPGALFFGVKDPVDGYRRIASEWRRTFDLPVIVVAGSVGKTTTKELLASILSGKFKRVLKTTGSQNGFLGIPMTLLELTAEHEVAVIEVGIDEPGAMAQHMALVGATHALLTTIGEEHLEKLKDLRTIAFEEGIALRSVAESGGCVAVNMDDPWIRPLISGLRSGSAVEFSLSGKIRDQADGAVSGSLSHAILEVAAHSKGKKEAKSFLLPLPLPGEHNALNLLAATAMAWTLGLTAEEIQKGLACFKGAEGRSEIRKIPSGNTVICDYYNANPSSMVAGLKLLSQLAPENRWACLGDMLELGPEELEFHRKLSSAILKLGIENVLLYGPRMKELEAELQKGGLSGKLRHFDSHSAMASVLLKESIPSGGTILIKGSHGMRMEELWKKIQP